INNPESEVGSIFCLYNQNNYTTFKVNLDALSHSKVHIDPRVLLLAKNAE
ncbi:YfiR family protein, partial [Acinetobacter baumannii]